jgi:hypothetical protein
MNAMLNVEDCNEALEQWSSTWGARTAGGTLHHLTENVKLTENTVYSRI